MLLMKSIFNKFCVSYKLTAKSVDESLGDKFVQHYNEFALWTAILLFYTYIENPEN